MANRERNKSKQKAQSLQDVRARIDTIDDELLRLFNERASLAADTAAAKKAEGDANCYRPEREQEVLRRLGKANPGPIRESDLRRLYGELISVCRSMEQELRVACFGDASSHTYAALLQHFGHSVQVEPCQDIGMVFRAVERNECEHGVVPVENSSEGSVNHTLDMFMDTSLCIDGEIEMRIRHGLWLASGLERAATRKVYGHAQALAQCRNWLSLHMPHAKCIPAASSSDAVQRAVRDRQAALAGEHAGDAAEGLHLDHAGIEDKLLNTTRFLVLGRGLCQPSGDDKTSILFATANHPGSLCQMLQCMARHEVSMTRIESRPSGKGNWEYVFFVDLEGHSKDEKVSAALNELSSTAAMYRCLGSYPKARSQAAGG